MPARPAAGEHDAWRLHPTPQFECCDTLSKSPVAAMRRHQRRTAVADERQRQALRREQPEAHAHVDQRLQRRAGTSRPAPDRSRSDRARAAPRAARARTASRNAARSRQRADQPQLLADDREDEVGMRGGQVVTPSAARGRSPTPVSAAAAPPRSATGASWKPAPPAVGAGSRNVRMRCQAIGLGRPRPARSRTAPATPA